MSSRRVGSVLIISVTPIQKIIKRLGFSYLDKLGTSLGDHGDAFFELSFYTTPKANVRGMPRPFFSLLSFRFLDRLFGSSWKFCLQIVKDWFCIWNI